MTNRIILAVLLGFLVIGTTAGEARKPKPLPCLGGRFVDQGDGLIPGDSSPERGVIFVASAAASVGSACAGVDATIRGGRKASTIAAVWAQCEGQSSRVRLKARIDAHTCSTLTGVLRGKRWRRRIHATRSPENPPAPCTESWCAGLESYCERLFALCPAIGTLANGDALGLVRQACVDATGTLVRTHGDQAPETQAALTCMQAATSCQEAVRCKNMIVPTGPAGEEGEISGRPVPVGQADLTPLAPGVVALPGDDLACVSCALAHCGAVVAHCFIDPAATPGCYAANGTFPDPTDCCADYRACLAECEQEDDVRYFPCASDCGRFQQGRLEFLQYQACMAQQCATCGGS